MAGRNRHSLAYKDGLIVKILMGVNWDSISIERNALNGVIYQVFEKYRRK